MQSRRRTTQILLESATIVGVEGGALVLSMPSPGMARRVLESANSDQLRAALREVLGVNWGIRCDAGGPGGGGRPARSGGPGPNRPAGGGVPTPGGPVDDIPLPDGPSDPDPEFDSDIPDDYNEPPDPAQQTAARTHDPEAAAIELLTTQLGARPLDGPAAPA